MKLKPRIGRNSYERIHELYRMELVVSLQHRPFIVVRDEMVVFSGGQKMTKFSTVTEPRNRLKIFTVVKVKMDTTCLETTSSESFL